MGAIHFCHAEFARTIWPKAIANLAMGNAHVKNTPNNIWLKANLNQSQRCRSSYSICNNGWGKVFENDLAEGH